MTHRADPDYDARRTLELLGPAPENWVPDRPGIDHNVLIVGGGQTGCAFAFALRRAGIGRVSVIDTASDAAKAGVWLNRARMNKLRTPKTLVGPEGGLPGLGFRAWYEARFGEASYQDIDRIPRERWAEYLAWYRAFLQIPVRYGTRLVRIEAQGSHFRLHLDVNGVAQIETARKVLLCNGVAGNGGAFVPPVLAQLPKSLVAHTSEAIDFAALRGQSVAVLGGAASAFDAAATALEAGASEVHLFVRRKTLAATPVSRARAYPGAYDNYFDLPDALRWAQALRFKRSGSTAPPDSVERVTRFENFYLHPGSQWESAREAAGRIHAVVSGESFSFDFAIAGTGYFIDPAARPELADFASHVLLWRDRFTPAEDDRDDELGAHPYLGAALEYKEKVAGSAPYLKDIHVYNPAGFVNAGVPVGDVPSMKRDIPSVVRRISRDLFLADLESHANRLASDVPAEFDESAYAANVWRRETSSA
ncbi:NAD(P)/FAD-dependent oxidoreductase [Paraburkholderia strydomiana]|uniref:NAD(P)/FAD-dependent oxidoreductase n=1 Tax=Paraburkholderia strydomiana TaxID=1245417 RepID=UPI002859EFED|nr:NAD(P)/FAD-dependent oxidoreductase [Paraburkholderia strydomiana]MDR7009808.1 cation diffusion facilitator CzcD-associated flavoprotein CzcO [Paraburkholderia strydomiana]